MNQEERWLLDEKYNGEKTAAFLTDVEALKNGTPLAYLIGSIPFLNCQIFLDSHPLIPRPETEYWTKHAIDEIEKTHTLQPNNSIHALDLCAGSGAIGVAIAKALPYTLVDFAEIETLHLPTILRNLTHNQIDPERSVIIRSDLFENISGKYSFILSNPPYIDPAIDRAEESVKTHEPHISLYGGTKGMELIKKIISKAPNHLENKGQLWLEHEPEQSIAINQLAEQNNFYCTNYKDQYGVERYSILVLK